MSNAIQQNTVKVDGIFDGMCYAFCMCTVNLAESPAAQGIPRSSEDHHAAFRDDCSQSQIQRQPVQALGRYQLGTIGDMLAVVQDGLHGVRKYVPVGVPLLGVGNVTEDGIDLFEVNRVTQEEHDRLVASQVARGDLLVTITGRLGTAAIYDSDAPANLSAHVALCRAKSGYELLYLKHYLASRFGAASLTKAQIGSTHPHINVRRLVELPIPLPGQQKQYELAATMEAARAERRAKQVEADGLLAGLDDYLLASLGLIRPRKDERKVFAVSIADLGAQARLNADYFHPERILAIRALAATMKHLTCPRLEQVVDFIRDQIRAPGPNYLSLANVQSNTGELVATDAGSVRRVPMGGRGRAAKIGAIKMLSWRPKAKAECAVTWLSRRQKRRTKPAVSVGCGEMRPPRNPRQQGIEPARRSRGFRGINADCPKRKLPRLAAFIPRSP